MNTGREAFIGRGNGQIFQAEEAENPRYRDNKRFEDYQEMVVERTAMHLQRSSISQSEFEQGRNDERHEEQRSDGSPVQKYVKDAVAG